MCLCVNYCADCDLNLLICDKNELTLLSKQRFQCSVDELWMKQSQCDVLMMIKVLWVESAAGWLGPNGWHQHDEMTLHWWQKDEWST